MVKTILIGGPTGIGKSRFVDLMVGDTNKFSRPKSYTTRKRRTDEIRNEYEYVSYEEFQNLRNSNVFVTVDEIYGNYYAMSYHSIAEINQKSKIAIKEVHPKNHAKLKNLLSEVISVLILPAKPEKFWSDIELNSSFLSTDRLERIKEDCVYYTSLDTQLYPFDIVLYAETDELPESLKEKFLHSFINLLLKSDKDVDDLKSIETTNKLGYDLIANDFSDDKRITTANFHDISLGFFEKQISKYASKDKSVLDLGTGRGYLIPILQNFFPTIVCADISKQMLSFVDSDSSRLIKVVASAFNLPFTDNSFDIVVASLIDPFLRREALQEIIRILVNGGVFIFSSPSKVWSDAIRKSSDTFQILTKFTRSSGSEVTVYSFTYTNEELQNLLVSCGFQIEILEIAYGQELKNYSRAISPALIKAAENLSIELDALPIIQLVVARKVI